jgi:CubicO group peptidase (beta-lactamase class C family)
MAFEIVMKQRATRIPIPKKCGRCAIVLWLAPFVLVATSAVTHADATDDYVRTEMAKKKIPGLSVAVMRDAHVVKEAAYGVASVELGAPVTLDTVYMLASMTKIFTAAAVMQLVQERRISLDEPVTQILTQLPAQWSTITIRHCLSHTSGLPDVVTDDINVFTVSGDRDSALSEIAKQSLKPAGVASVYNQTGYVLLSMVIEKISGMSYKNFVQSRLFNPAGMKTARFGDAWAIIPGRADLYTALDIAPDHLKLLIRDGRPVLLTDKILHYGSKYMPDYMAPAGLLNGSIRDLVNWEKVLAEGKLLKTSSLKEMATPYRLRDGRSGDFGLGFVTLSLPNAGPYAIVSYGGGAATWRLTIPEKHLTVIVLTNLQDSQPESIALAIAAFYEPSVATTHAQ